MIAVLYLIGKSIVPRENRRSRFALIMALGVAGLLLMANAVYGLYASIRAHPCKSSHSGKGKES